MTLFVSYPLQNSFIVPLEGRSDISGAYDGGVGITTVATIAATGQLEVSMRPGITAASTHILLDGLSNGVITRLISGDYVVAAQDANSIVRTIISASGEVLDRTDLGDTGSTEARVVALNNGGYVIASTDQVAAGNTNVELRFFDAGGVQVATVPVDITGALDSDASVAVLSNGDVAVAWTRATGQETDVFYAIYSSSGAVVRAPSLLDGAGPINRNPVIAATPGGFTVLHEAETAFGVGLSISDFTRDGVPGARRVESLFGTPLSDASVLSLPTGQLIVSALQGSSLQTVFLLGETAARPVLNSVVTDSLDGGALIGLGDGRFVGAFDRGAGAGGLFDLTVVRSVVGDAAADVFTGDGITSRVRSGGGADQLNGGNAAEFLSGDDGDDIINGGGGDDVLVGGAGLDALNGGSGVDTADYSTSAGGANVRLDANAADDGRGGIDTLVSIENVIGSAFSDTLRGSASANRLAGGDGGDTLAGLRGNDILDGGAGFDFADYSLAAAGVTASLVTDRASSDGDGGVDTLISIEGITGSRFNDLLIGGAGNDHLRGGEGADTLLGQGGDDVLTGGPGAANTLQGGTGNDTYVVSANDTLVELAGEGVDQVHTDLAAFTLGANFETLLHTGVRDFTGTGNALDNTLTGGARDDILRGRGGDDSLNGGDDGSDTADYSLAAAGVTARIDTRSASNDGDGGVDTFTSIENLTGSAFNDLLIGDGAANVLSGGLGRDVILGLGGADIIKGGAGVANELYGGVGDDIYIVEHRSDSIVELTGEGVDSVHTALAQVNLAANVEFLLYTGAGSFTGVGNAGDNTIFGREQRDVLIGGAGDDTLFGGSGAANELYGGAGDDSYMIQAADTIIEGAGDGVDTVFTSVLTTYTLGANVENLTYSGFRSFTAGGNALNNVLTGGDASDVLRGRGGSDTLDGGEGIDTADYSLALAAVLARIDAQSASNDGDGGADVFISIENLIGSAFNDTLIGGSGSNELRGGLGADTLLGFAGNDTLSGGQGAANTLQGGTGDDFYVVEARDSIIELAGEGVDTIIARLNTQTMAANVEVMKFGGTGAFRGTGNAGANTITGGDGDDILKGMGGEDVLKGGQGADEVQFRGARAQYTVTVEGTGYRIVDTVAGRDGSTRVESVETLRFMTDGAITVLTYSPGTATPDSADKGLNIAQVLPPLIDDQPLVLPGRDVIFARTGFADDIAWALPADPDAGLFGRPSQAPGDTALAILGPHLPHADLHRPGDLDVWV